MLRRLASRNFVACLNRLFFPGHGLEFEPTDSGKKRLSAKPSASSFFEFEPTQSGKKSIRPGTHDTRFLVSCHGDVLY